MFRIRLVKMVDMPAGTGCVVVKVRLSDKREWSEMGGIPEMLVPPTVVGGTPQWTPINFVFEAPEERGDIIVP